MEHEPADLAGITRRHFFGRSAMGLGGLALSSMLGPAAASASQAVTDFQAVIEVVKSTGVEAEIAEQKIIEAYQAAKNQAGDSTAATLGKLVCVTALNNTGKYMVAFQIIKPV